LNLRIPEDDSTNATKTVDTHESLRHDEVSFGEMFVLLYTLQIVGSLEQIFCDAILVGVELYISINFAGAPASDAAIGLGRGQTRRE